VSVAAVVPAAGRGERLGPGQPKALRTLGGVPMLVHAVRALSRARMVDIVVVAVPPADLSGVTALLGMHDLAAEVSVVAGGAERHESVALALEALPADVTTVLVHDAARPLAPSELVDSVASAVLAGHRAVVPGVPITDTVKRLGAGGESFEAVAETLPRSDLRAIQTPQGFDRRLLAEAYEAARHLDGAAAIADDARLVEMLGVPVVVVPGSAEAFKIVKPIDLILAEAVLADRRAAGAL
jgi:2-C-methyl-D-erythritol 4-phosphate cytidylyltransferase